MRKRKLVNRRIERVGTHDVHAKVFDSISCFEEDQKIQERICEMQAHVRKHVPDILDYTWI